MDTSKPGSMVSLFDLEQNVPVSVPQEYVAEFLQSGRYAPKKDATFKVKDNTGDLYDVPGTDLLEALKTPGVTVETSEEQFKREADEKYGNIGGQALTFAEGAASGATLGLSTQALTRSGLVEPETIEQMREANPATHIAGEVVGTVAPMFAGSPTSLIGKAAKTAAAPIEAASAVGRGTEKLIQKLLVTEGASNPIVRSITSKIIPKAVGSAVEGSLIGVGQLLDENALGKADVNAENLIAVTGPAAILGAGFGGSLAAAGELLGPVVKFSQKQLEKAANSFADENVAAAELLGKTPSQIAKGRTARKQLYDDAAKFLKEDLQLNVQQSADERLNRLLQVERESGQEIGKMINQIDEEIAQIPREKLPTRRDFYNSTIDDILKVRRELGEGFGSQEQIATLNSLYKDAERLREIDGALSAKELIQQRRQVDDIIKWTRAQVEAPAKEQALREIRRTYNKQIDALADLATERVRATESALGKSSNELSDLGNQWRSANKRYSFTQEFKQSLEKKALNDASLQGGLWQTAYKIATGGDLKAKAAVLMNIEKANQKVFKVINNAVDGFANGVRATELPVRVVIQDSVLSRDLKNKKAATKEQAVINMMQNLQKATAAPEAFMESLNKKTAPLYKGAPATSQQIDINMVRALTFLNSKMPKYNVNNGLMTPFKQPRFSNAEISKFERYYEAVENPLGTIKRLKNNTLTRDHVDALKAVYPNIFSQLQDSVMGALAKQPHSFSYNKKVQIGILMGIPTDVSMLPQNVMGLQQNFLQQEEQGNGAVPSTVGGLEKINKSDSLATETEKIEED